MKGRYITDNKH